MAKLIEFSKNNLLKYESPIKGNAFLELSAINALADKGIACNEDGVIQYQSEQNLEPTGKIDSKTLLYLVADWDVHDKQKVIEELDVADKKAAKSTKIENIKIFIWLTALAFFEVLGVITAYKWVIGMIFGGN